MKGTCLCKAVSFEIDGTVHNGRYCHCANCRKFSGTAYAAWGLVPTERFTITASEGGVTKFDSGGGNRVFCSTCGSPLWFEPAGLPQFRGIPLGAIDDRDVPGPLMHVWMKSKVPWAAVADDLPQHETHP